MRTKLTLKTLSLLSTLALLSLSLVQPAFGADVTLAWDPNTESDVAGYKLYYGTASHAYDAPLDVKNVTTYTVTGLGSATYYFAVTAYNTSGLESGFSNEVSMTTGGPLISSVIATGITTTAAHIRWTTSVASDSQVEYGLSTAYGSLTQVNTGLVTTHSQDLTGLTAGRLYYYRVKSKDAAGNITVSGDFNFTAATTGATTDTTPPIISSVSTSGVTGSAATVSWTTNEAADAEVEYGPSAAYGRSTGLFSTLMMAHSQGLTGLAAGTLYHYRVKSKDAAGNLAVSADFIFTTGTRPDTVSPVISDTLVVVGDTSAKITWTTNEAANSRVDFGISSGYGNSVSDPARVTSHSAYLVNLTTDTTYHFKVTSLDSAGNAASSADRVFKTLAKNTAVTLYYPNLGSRGKSTALGSDSDYVVLAVSNLDSVPAILTLTAFDTAGDVLSGPGIINPAGTVLRPGEQIPVIDTQIFGDGIADAPAVGWIQVESSTPKVSGFFMSFDSSLSRLDGAAISSSLTSSFVLPEIGDRGVTRLHLANPNPNTALVKIDLVEPDGSVRGTVQTGIKAYGTLSAELYGELFSPSLRDSSDYIRVDSNLGLLPYESFSMRAKDIAVLAGQDVANNARVLFSPQYIVGGPWRSTLSLVNLDSENGSASLRFIREDGQQVGMTKTVLIRAHGKAFISDQDFFQTARGHSDEVTQGYVEVVANGVRLAGSIVFEEAGSGSFISALPLVSTPRNSLVFSHVASNDLYFTGIALLNPSDIEATAAIELYGPDGNLKGKVISTIGARQRKSCLLTEYFPGLIGQNTTSGYVKVTASTEVAGFGLFGTNDLSVLSAIPAQLVPK